VGVPVGGDHAQANAPGRFDLAMLIRPEHGLQAGVLPVREEVRTGVLGPSCRIERLAGSAAVSVEVLRDSSSALVEGVTSEAADVEGVHHRGRTGKFFGGGGLEPREPVHRDDIHAVAPVLRPGSEPVFEHLLRLPGNHV